MSAASPNPASLPDAVRRASSSIAEAFRLTFAEPAAVAATEDTATPSTTFLDRWSSLVDGGLRDLFWSGLVLVGLVLRIFVLAIATPFAWLGIGAARAVDTIRTSDRKE